MGILRHKEDQKENELKNQGTNVEMNSKPKTQSPYHIGYITKGMNEIPVTMYFNKGYINDELEFAINSKTWKVYFFGVHVGNVNDNGSIDLNVEDIENE